MEDCIEWSGPKWSNGRYGVVNINGKSRSAHRVAWEKENGKIPDGMHVCHKCDNTICINPDHLFLGTHRDNMQDCISKGRFNFDMDQKGQKNNNAKPNLRKRYKKVKNLRADGYTYSEIREECGIKSNGHLKQILDYEF